MYTYGQGFVVKSYVAVDGNGNILTLVNSSDGSTVASYEYSPFGECIKATGPMAQANPFRFSTKYSDDETGLIYYGYRYYDAKNGRWVSRDLIEEESFVRNNTGLMQELLAHKRQQAQFTINDISLADHLIQSSANLQLAFENSPIIKTDYLGLKCIVYVMIGHFGTKNEETGEVTPAGDIWDQLGTSTFKLDKDDAVLSLSCHMVSFLNSAKAKFPDVVTPSGWPPTPYNDDRKVYLGDFVNLLNEGNLNKAAQGLVNELFNPTHCCDKVEVRARCDPAAASGLAISVKTGHLKTINPCANGGFTKTYFKSSKKAGSK